MPGKRGHVQEGRRFAVIVQADDLLALSLTLLLESAGRETRRLAAGALRDSAAELVQSPAG